MITYRIKPHRPEAHLFRVLLTIESPDPNGQILSLPAWIPGSYMIRDFARNIVSLKARTSDIEIEAVKLDKQTWQLAGVDQPVIIEYEVYAWDLSVRSAHLDTTHGYFNGTSVFLRVHGEEQRPCEVWIEPPEGDLYVDWRLATSLHADGAEPLSFGRYRASGYRELIDHPVEMGSFTHISFTVQGVDHEVAITGQHSADMERLAVDLEKICSRQIEMFGELPSMPRYLFMVLAVGDGYGGLEHKESTSLICKRSDLPRKGEPEITKDYRQFLGLCSHEYFHLWNVKRIIPGVFKDSDLSQEAHSRLLWAFEGITSYYDDLMLVRSGVIERESYLELLGKSITRLMRTPGRFRQSVSESSFDAWTKFYKQDENAPNAIVSYYVKGALIALCLDLTIREKSSGLRSLDDVMRRLWQEFGAQEKGLAEDDVERIASEVTGLDLDSFFDQTLRGTLDLPLEEMLQSVGVGFQIRHASSSKDQGGLRGKESAVSPVYQTLGLLHTSHGNEVRVSSVMDLSPAQQAGISAGDLLVAINGIRITSENYDLLKEQLSIGDQVEIHAFRRDELMSFELQVAAPERDTCDLWFEEDADEVILKARELWLG